MGVMIAIPNITSSSDSTSICSLSCKTIYSMLADQSRNMIIIRKENGKTAQAFTQEFLSPRERR